MKPTEYKIMNLFMIKAAETGDLENISIKASDVVKQANIKSTAYSKVLKKEAEIIMKTLVTIESISEPGKWEQFSLIPYMKYEDGILTCKFNKDLTPYILGTFSNFTKTEYKQITSCSTYTAMRLYEICNRWKDTGIAYYELEKWRKLLGATTKSYEKFSNFKRWCLEPAIEEVNEKTDLFITVSYEKKGAAVSHIRIGIRRKINQEEPALFADKPKIEYRSNEENAQLCLLEMMDVFKIKENTARSYILQYGTEFCKKQMEYVLKQKEFVTIKSLGGYLKKALEEDYAGVKEIAEEAKKAEKEEKEDIEQWNRDARKPLTPPSKNPSQKKAEALWEATLQMAAFQADQEESKITENVVNRWLKDLHPLSFENNILKIDTEQEFRCNWINTNYKEALETFAKQVAMTDIRLEFVSTD